MLIDGEKYACDACVRGHRVSNCNHYERPLTHINKKGRPVSQCPHCRGLRKARSSHVKCECGTKGKGDDKKCCCGNGGRCTCALKKDRLDPVRESGIPSLTRSRSHTDSRKARTSPNHCHSALSRKNHAGAECRPYHISRPHSIHGSQGFNNSAESLPLPTTPDLPSRFEFFQMEERMVRSEHGSPGMPPVQMRSELPHLDLDYSGHPSVAASPVPSDFNTSFTPFDASYIPNTTADDLPPPSAALSMEVDWQSMGILDTPFSAEFPPAPSYASFDQGPTSHPGLTTASSSGDVSEAEEFMSFPSPVPGGRSPYTQFDDQTGMGSFNMSTESLSASLNNMTPSPMLSSSAAMNTLVSQISLEPFMRGHTPQSPVPMDDFNGGVGSPAEQGYGSPFRQDVPKMTHSGLLDARGPSPPVMRPTPTSDPRWNAPNSFVKEENQFGVAGMQEPVWT